MLTRRLIILAAVMFLFAGPRLAFSDPTYVVKKGDTLYKIGKRLNVSPEEIRAENGLKSNIIRVGQTLMIPKKKVLAHTEQKYDGAADRSSGVDDRSSSVDDQSSAADRSSGVADQSFGVAGQSSSVVAYQYSDAVAYQSSSVTADQSSDVADQFTGVVADQSSGVADRSSSVAVDRPSDIADQFPDVADQSSGAAVRVHTGPAQIHRVRQGDTLWSLSRKYGVRVSELRRLNRIQGGKGLRAGTPVIIREALPETYTVEEGDSLVEIANKFGMNTEELVMRNNFDSHVLTPGMRLKLFDWEEEPEPIADLLDKFALISEKELIKAAQPRDDGEEPVQARIVRVAMNMLFIPYVWGGTSLNGMDCSAFVLKVFGLMDMKLPRSAREQYQVGVGVARSKLSVADLVFFRTYAKFPSHVGIYLGDNKFIHVSSGSRHVKITSLDNPYYKKRYIGARRVIVDQEELD